MIKTELKEVPENLELDDSEIREYPNQLSCEILGYKSRKKGDWEAAVGLIPLSIVDDSYMLWLAKIDRNPTLDELRFVRQYVNKQIKQKQQLVAYIHESKTWRQSWAAFIRFVWYAYDPNTGNHWYIRRQEWQQAQS